MFRDGSSRRTKTFETTYSQPSDAYVRINFSKDETFKVTRITRPMGKRANELKGKAMKSGSGDTHLTTKN